MCFVEPTGKLCFRSSDTRNKELTWTWVAKAFQPAQTGSFLLSSVYNACFRVVSPTTFLPTPPPISARPPSPPSSISLLILPHRAFPPCPASLSAAVRMPQLAAAARGQDAVTTRPEMRRRCGPGCGGGVGCGGAGPGGDGAGGVGDEGLGGAVGSAGLGRGCNIGGVDPDVVAASGC